jgi:peptide/nickel transport system permease protein
MTRFILQRLLLLPPALLLIHFLGFAYAIVGRWFNATRNPFFAPPEGPLPILPEYLAYAQSALGGNFGKMPSGSIETILGALARTGAASLGLLGIVFALSVALGLIFGLSAVRIQPRGVVAWLIPASTVSLAMPSFYVGAILITATLFYLLWFAQPGSRFPLPLGGFGWDLHLVFPVTALTVRPTMQIAQASATLLAGELGKQYVVAARSIGASWFSIRWKHALRNVAAPLVIAISGSLRLLVAELILVESLFRWPGLGSLLADTLYAPQTATVFNPANAAPLFLDPPVVAAALTCIAALFMLIDLIASILTRYFDPRFRAGDERGSRHG